MCTLISKMFHAGYRYVVHIFCRFAHWDNVGFLLDQSVRDCVAECSKLSAVEQVSPRHVVPLFQAADFELLKKSDLRAVHPVAILNRLNCAFALWNTSTTQQVVSNFDHVQLYWWWRIARLHHRNYRSARRDRRWWHSQSLEPCYVHSLGYQPIDKKNYVQRAGVLAGRALVTYIDSRCSLAYGKLVVLKGVASCNDCEMEPCDQTIAHRVWAGYLCILIRKMSHYIETICYSQLCCTQKAFKLVKCPMLPRSWKCAALCAVHWLNCSIRIIADNLQLTRAV